MPVTIRINKLFISFISARSFAYHLLKIRILPIHPPILQTLYPKLLQQHSEYIFRVLHLADFDAAAGADAQLFSIAAKFCGKIESSGSWMHQMILRQDQGVLVAKWHKVSHMSEYKEDQ